MSGGAIRGRRGESERPVDPVKPALLRSLIREHAAPRLREPAGSVSGYLLRF